MQLHWENWIPSTFQNPRMVIFFLFFYLKKEFWKFLFHHSTPLAWQPAYLYTLLLLVFFFLLKALLSEPLKFLRQYWKHLSGQSTAWLTEGIKKINCCGLKEIKLHMSIKKRDHRKVLWHCGGACSLQGSSSTSHTHKLSSGESTFSPSQSLRCSLRNGLTAFLPRALSQ